MDEDEDLVGSASFKSSQRLGDSSPGNAGSGDLAAKSKASSWDSFQVNGVPLSPE